MKIVALKGKKGQCEQYNEENLGGSGSQGEFRTDLPFYFVNNTMIDCGNHVVTDNYGIIFSEVTAASPFVVYNNIIDYTNDNGRCAARYKGEQSYVDYNIYTERKGTTTSTPPLGSDIATWFQYSTNQANGNGEHYEKSGTTLTTFAPKIGPDGVYIPDFKIKEGEDGSLRGKDYRLIGDTYTDSYGTHQLGKDPTGRSFAYDILGNLRTTNDIGAVGTASSSDNQGINVNTKIWLEGPFYNGNMLLLLHEEGHIPLNQNFSSAPWNYNGSESVSSVPNSVVDWVLLELRTSTAASTTVARKAVFLKNDGSIVALDGISKPSFGELSSGSYYIVIRHRNHLDIMSANPVSLSFTSSLYDFTTGPDKAYGSNPLIDLGNGMWGMCAGDGDYNGIVNVIDYGTVGNFLLQTGYKYGDLDLNGVINVLDYSKTNSNLFRNSQVPK